MTGAWEIERAKDPLLRWVCADCLLLNAEHPLGPWWGCAGRWIEWGRGR
jgi:hypothetical protein